ncbi:uncharacterized protein BCR38DRAFT_522030 [Pseudomassariella vexata]|uniref:2EXR domain-containing protein n=1 Tax=Pseudomassariella vexata TaxID=1141098 RepID=A0A1Y2E662_9PEZI|nr:uncharacterized protein BCR38DRAFT_522030 [Pseudomassariella vexata]ORY66999.1 hypothetical protein BCR38DRAFT_522030 [Pseudomassariella vexata]
METVKKVPDIDCNTRASNSRTDPGSDVKNADRVYNIGGRTLRGTDVKTIADYDQALRKGFPKGGLRKNQPGRFMSLPTELRRMIYCQLALDMYRHYIPGKPRDEDGVRNWSDFHYDNSRTIVWRHDDTPWELYADDDEQDYATFKYDRNPWISNLPAIMRTCKEVYKEAKPEFFQFCFMMFEGKGYLEDWDTKIDIISPGRFRPEHIRDLHIEWLQTICPPIREFLEYVFRAAKNLQLLHFDTTGGNISERSSRKLAEILGPLLLSSKKLRVVRFTGQDHVWWANTMREKLKGCGTVVKSLCDKACDPGYQGFQSTAHDDINNPVSSRDWKVNEDYFGWYHTLENNGWNVYTQDDGDQNQNDQEQLVNGQDKDEDDHEEEGEDNNGEKI